mgnify:CR=1 FL=1
MLVLVLIHLHLTLWLLLDQNEKNLEGIKENLKDIFDISADLNEGDNFVGPSGNLYNFFKDKTDKQIEDFWNYYSDQGLDGSDWNFADLVSKL